MRHIELLTRLHHAVEKMSVEQTAAAGGIGSGISLATVVSIDPLRWVVWLQVATLSVGLLTGLASLALVVMKLVQHRREMRR
ncbi:MAG TPA: hypothetical protein VJK06_02985 [Methyloceanibacter sp.]|nr:hypothetical protein [Methyloceanibacter sp.]